MTKWGYILQAPGRPSLAKQRETLKALGLDADEYGPIWTDTLMHAKRGRGAMPEQLPARNDLLRAVQAGDEVIAAAPYCLGLSPGDVTWFIGALSALGVSVLSSGPAFRVAPGGDASGILVEVRRAQSRSNTAQHRARQMKPKLKSD